MRLLDANAALQGVVDQYIREKISPMNWDQVRKNIADSRRNTVERAKDIWGLDYAENSDGWYPSGNQIGRAHYLPGMTRGEQGSKQVMPSIPEWRTVFAAKLGGHGVNLNDAIALGTDEAGFLYATNKKYKIVGGAAEAWLDFIVDEDIFVIHHGMFSKEESTIKEFQMILSGVNLPSGNCEMFYDPYEERRKFYLETPNVVSPKSQIIYNLRSTRKNLDGGEGGKAICPDSEDYDPDSSINEIFGPLGEIIAKRSFIIRPTW